MKCAQDEGQHARLASGPRVEARELSRDLSDHASEYKRASIKFWPCPKLLDRAHLVPYSWREKRVSVKKPEQRFAHVARLASLP